MECVISLLGIGVVLVFIFLVRKRPLDHIPGPKAYPIVGNVLQLNMNNLFIRLAELGKQYGGIFKLKLVTNHVIVVSDPDAIYEVLVKQTAKFAGRPYNYRIGLQRQFAAIAFTDEGVEHKSRRKVVHSFLKQFGSGIEKIEQVTQTATDDLIATLSEDCGMPMDIRDKIVHCVMDIMVILLKGETLSTEKIQRIKKQMDIGFEYSGQDPSGVLLDLFPVLRFFGNKAYTVLQQCLEYKNELISGWMEEHPTDGYVSFLQGLSEQEQKQNFFDTYNAQSGSIWEFMVAGVYTSSSTLTALMNVLVHYPRVQEKLREEVMRVIGMARYPTLQDQDKLPYLRATLLEIGRFVSIVPLAIPHKTTQRTRLNGYDIPVETEVWVNLWALHHDEKLWDEPFAFKPERFLDDNGQLVPADHPNRKNVLPFSAGQRVCVGEVFAMSRMFLITARILQHFTILPESSVEKQPSCDPREMKMGLILLPPAFKVRLVPVEED